MDKPTKYRFIARCDKIIDGDTVDLVVDLGFAIYHNVRVRLKDIDTPELRSRDRIEKMKAKACKEELERLLPVGGHCLLVSEKTGKYGRWIGELITDREGESVNEKMKAFLKGLG